MGGRLPHNGWIKARWNAALFQAFYGRPIGPLAMKRRELRQARKGATVAALSCAGVWLVWSATLSLWGGGV